MRLRLVLASLLMTLSVPALADPQDFQLYKLGEPVGTKEQIDAINNNFRIFANQLGVGISSFNLSPPETLGHSAFNFGVVFAAAKVDPDAAIWPRAGQPASDMLLMPTAYIRKGLPFSFEIGGKFSYLMYSRMSAATVEVKWALNEGFNFLPQLGVRGQGTKLIGSRDLNLVTAGVDVGLGWQVPVGGMLTLTPYVGWHSVMVNANSGVLDFAPGRTLENAQTAPTEHTGVFQSVNLGENLNNRFYGGIRLVTYVVELIGEFSYTQIYGGRKVMTYSGKFGLDF
jgi:hypothetical protein